jgi:hypothetical protein
MVSLLCTSSSATLGFRGKKPPSNRAQPCNTPARQADSARSSGSSRGNLLASLVRAQQPVHPRRRIAFELVGDALIVPQDSRVGVSHDRQRDRIRNAGGEEQRGCPMPERVEGDPFPTVSASEPSPGRREAGREPRLSIAPIDDELGSGMADLEEPLALTLAVTLQRSGDEPGSGSSRSPAADLGGPMWSSPPAAVIVRVTATVSPTSDHRRARTSSRRRLTPSARCTAASHGSFPMTAARIAWPCFGVMIGMSFGSPAGRCSSAGSATFRPTRPRASARERA